MTDAFLLMTDALLLTTDTLPSLEVANSFVTQMNCRCRCRYVFYSNIYATIVGLKLLYIDSSTIYIEFKVFKLFYPTFHHDHYHDLHGDLHGDYLPLLVLLPLPAFGLILPYLMLLQSYLLLLLQ
jgi:hypothetical protein